MPNMYCKIHYFIRRNYYDKKEQTSLRNKKENSAARDKISEPPKIFSEPPCSDQKLGRENDEDKRA